MAPFSVHAHAAAAFINVCEGVERQHMLPYLDPIVRRLLAMLQPTSRAWVQEQAVTTLAMVADVSEDTFRSVSLIYLIYHARLIRRGTKLFFLVLFFDYASYAQRSA